MLAKAEAVERPATETELLAPLRRRHPFITFFRRYPSFGIGAAILTVMVLIAVLAPWLGTVDPSAINPANRIKDPSAAHWLGTDMLGRDLYSRVIYGTRVSLIVGISAALLSSVIGLFIGLVSGSIRLLDGIIMRIIDGLLAIPPILLAIALVAIAGGSLFNVIVALTVAEVPRVTRLIRGVVLSVRGLLYIDAAIASGTSMPVIIFRHILPSTLPTLSVQATFICASAMIIEAALSFLGVGTPSSIPSWGNIMSDARTLWQIKPLIVFVPATMLIVTILGVNLLGDGIRDMIDPKSSRRLL